jgi:hypothetical protein
MELGDSESDDPTKDTIQRISEGAKNDDDSSLAHNLMSLSEENTPKEESMNQEETSTPPQQLNFEALNAQMDKSQCKNVEPKEGPDNSPSSSEGEQQTTTDSVNISPPPPLLTN